MKKERIRYYNSFDDDFEIARDQNFKLPEDYKWIKRDFISKALSFLVYTAALIFSSVYNRFVLHITFSNRKVLRSVKRGGYFLYCNHTQPIGDVFTPALAVFPKRIYTVVSPANFSIPVIGKILTYLGALPIPDSISKMKEFNRAIQVRIEENKCIVIYPEAHVWEYCTQIRPFPDTSFKYPVLLNKPAFAITSTYKKSKLFKRPITKVYIDGPFYPDTTLNAKKQKEQLHSKIVSVMQKRSKESNFSYYNYEKIPQ
ncbi:MAG: 1-acyl-sn-glycerol-3-phosphate acyltransferase [Clostridia bacterium]|nr:1-acyl-sn-glycerol-3-phosphate acyltransferase [Clostridia bacterium]